MGLFIVIVLAIVVGIAVSKRLSNNQPKRVFFWSWTSPEKRARIIRAKQRELYPERFIDDKP
jgi:hypothetical protein